jgi:hypothetical protein
MWHAWWRGEVLTGFWLGGLKLRDHWEDLREIGINGVKWIQLAQDKVQWQACVNMVMNFQIP